MRHIQNLVIVCCCLVSYSVFASWFPEVGKPFPDIEMFDENGKAVKLSSLKGKPIVLQPVAFSCQGTQAFAGGHIRGAFAGGTPQAGLKSLEEYFPVYGKMNLTDNRVHLVQVVFRNMNMDPPKASDVKSWTRHFDMKRSSNYHVYGAKENWVNNSVNAMIPGVFLIDKDFVLRSDATGHTPRDNLYTETMPMAKKLMFEKDEGDVLVKAKPFEKLSDKEKLVSAYILSSTSRIMQLDNRLAQEKRFNESIVLLEAARKVHPNNAEIARQMSLRYSQVDRRGESITVMKEALALDPNSDWGHYWLGRIYRQVGDYSRADEALATAVEMNPRDWSYYYELGVLYKQMGGLEDRANEFYKLAYENKITDKKKRLIVEERLKSAGISLETRVSVLQKTLASLDYDKLEAHLGPLMRDRVKDKDGRLTFIEEIKPIATGAYLRYVRQWHAAKTGSELAVFVEAYTRYSMAWEARGGSTQIGTSDNSMKSYKSYLKEANFLFDSMLRKHPQSYFGGYFGATVKFELGQLSEAQAVGIVDKLDKIDPKAIMHFKLLTRMYDPAWGGSKDKLLKFSRKVLHQKYKIKSAAPRLIIDAYVRIAKMKSGFSSLTLPTLGEEQAWKEIEYATKVLQMKFPDSDYYKNYAGYVAYKAGRKEEASRALASVPQNSWDQVSWRNLGEFKKAKESY